MTWLMVVVLAIAAFLLMAFLLKAPRSGWETIGAALFLGIAGYGLQASPGLSGAPKAAEQNVADDPAALVEARGKVKRGELGPRNNWVVVADGLARNGQFANAANILLAAVEDDPKDSEAWLALGNALVAHADGLLTPPSLYAYRKASQADPDDPGPPFFLGLALARSGKLGEARALWTQLLERSPEDAPWRADLESRLQQLDDFIANAQGGGGGR